ncbi:unnamed protein product [Adineta ricciae]|uniref:Uncharacterized protein n=1 Tax=Adineta ricciae TaxID=249248 RepID=A0A815DTJ1_ADIRI|nr:unnamed protein product [Adineta ricciae]
MLKSLSYRQTSLHLLVKSSRVTLSTLPYPKSSQTQASPDGTPINYPTAAQTSSKDEKVPSISPNDLLAAKQSQKSSDIPAGHSLSSVPQTDARLSQDSKVSSTLVLPGEPLRPAAPPLATEQQRRTTTEYERLPSSRFSAFLRSIRSGLPFFSSKSRSASSINITTTREHFLPITRPSLIRLLATDFQLLEDNEERLLFHELCEGFDSAVVQRYHPILNELKNLFNPLNPDHEAIVQHQSSDRNHLDNEYWLLQKVDDLLHRSNFTELPRNLLVEKFIIQNDSKSSNVNVKINGYDYDVLKFWILGRETIPRIELSRWKRLFGRSNPAVSGDYFKRVILAVRLKGQDRLYLKAFRDIPLQHLPQLLPVGKLQIGHFEQRLIWSTFFVATSTAVTHLITTMANFHIPGLVEGGSGLTLLLTLWSIRSAYRSKINYLSNMNRVLFYKNIASNKQLLAMIIDRAEDELSKEILLVYMIVLWRQRHNSDLTKKVLELEVENWIRSKTNANINFHGDQALEFLRKLGILLPEDPARPNRLQVIPVKQVVGILPKVSRALSEKNEEWDLIEGYDKKYFEVDWKTVLNEDKLLQKGGWH